ncbi:MAG: 23S rRNA (adenine(2503)-C(2))-methyltransferase RlmN [Deltaproteobacteria bacterium]|nr:23S rRNA (adenine(2503)-C(2))-methyltransferase RlmN [Deltaproteobacteria bacterium]
MRDPSTSREPALGLTREDLRLHVSRLGAQAFRGDQVFRWMHASGVLDPSAMNNLPRELRESLADGLDFAAPRVVDRVSSGDGTEKISLELADGYRIESVLILSSEGDEQAAVTLCVSTQVGCRVRCRFCRSGLEGFRRNLEASEIVGQVAAARLDGARINRVVFMGIGEPLDNEEMLHRSIRILSDGEGVALAPRRLVVSTVGRPEAMIRLGEAFGGRVGLAVSLHAADPGLRARIVGAGRAAGPAEVLEAARAYPLPPRERVTVEVVLVRGLNDSALAAADLAAALKGLRCRVNLIPLNPFEGLDMEPPGRQTVQAFQGLLDSAGFPTFVRRRRGARILASCGQLAFGGSRTKEFRDD